MLTGVLVRLEEAGDRAAVHQLHQLAFEQAAEADLVDALREADAALLSLVAVTSGGDVVGHVLFSPVIVAAPAREFTAVGLAPMAVLPGHQRNGIGSLLARAGLDVLKSAGHAAVIVLGHPDYYPRFGFVPASCFGLRWELDAPDDAFMALELVPGALAGCDGGVVRYRPEFADV